MTEVEIPVSAQLHAAADAIQMAGWRQGSKGWVGHDGLCIEGGLMAALGVEYTDMVGFNDLDSLRQCPAYLAVVDFLNGSPSWNPTPSEHWHFLYAWNDIPGRSEDEVIGVLRAAAEVERLKELGASRVAHGATA